MWLIMRKKLIVLFFSLIGALTVLSQSKPVKVVFDITSKDTLAHQTVLRHVSLMAAYPESQVEVVIYGSALPMVVKDKSTIEKGLTDLILNKNVSFKACAITMKRHNVDKSQLIAGVTVVPDGLIEIVTKQSEGWGYIKE
jgi:intracellular sulfur oxidation DsrE/DsrF family protein